ncbi:MAG: SHOCT domain-containing protein [Desulfosalsimonas sp.]|uniref:SHOCT domain-containing protein n=1 Tax=Desulfosalsimonas sp. TaxID=3073848 RepID=UPI003970895C
MKRYMIAVLLVALFVAGCSFGGGRKDTDVAKDKDVVVRLEQQMKNGQVVDQNYRHPAEIKSFIMSWLLEDLRYMPQPSFIGRSGETEVFQQREIDRLAPALSKALASADSGQRVHFTSYNRAVGLIFEKKRKTEGVMFVDQNGTLHIAFAWINAVIDVDGEPKDSRSSQQFDVLELRHADTEVIAPKPYMQVYQFEDGKSAPMRLAVNVEHLRATVAREIGQQTGMQYAAPSGSQQDEFFRQPQEQQQMQTRQPAQQVQPAPAPFPQDKEALRKEVRDQLEYLKEIYEEGLITESEYEQQRKKALEALK